MRHRRFVIAGLAAIGFELWLSLPGSQPAYANPVFADERSLRNGAELYALYCSECHGSEIRVAPVATHDPSVDYSELIDIAQGKTKTPPPKVDKWPKWAERPAPVEPVEDEQLVTLKEIREVIEQTHKVKPTSDSPGISGKSSAQKPGRRFESKAGAPNLSDPQSFYYGTTEDEVFDSIAKGTGAAMPGWRTELGSDDTIWDVVNYIRSSWSQEWRY